MLQTQTLHGLISSSYEPLGALTSSKQRQHNVFWEILIKILQVSTQAQYFDCNLSPMRSKITARRALLRIAQSLQPWRDCLALLCRALERIAVGLWRARRGMAGWAHSSCAIITSQQRITLISAEHFYCRLKAFHGHAWVTLTNCWASRVWLLSGCRAHPGLLQSKETQSKCRANWQHCGGRGAD